MLYDEEQNKIRNSQIQAVSTPVTSNSVSATPTPDERRIKKIRTLTPPKPRGIYILI